MCVLNFNEKYLNKNENWVRLIKKLQPVPAIESQKLYEKVPSMLPAVVPLRGERHCHEYSSLTKCVVEALMIFKLKSFLMLIRKCWDTYRVMNIPNVIIKLFITKLKISECTWNFTDVAVHCLFISGSDKVMTALRSVTQTEIFPAYMKATADELPMELLNEINTDRLKNLFCFNESIYVSPVI